MTLTRFTSVLALLTFAGAACADTITAQYGVPSGYLSTAFDTALPGPGGIGTQSVGATLIQGHRLDSPGPGIDSMIPEVFSTYCVEIGETVQVGILNSYGPAYTHSVSPMLGSSTISGGISGSVLFDAVRTDRMELLWGLFQPSVASNLDHAAFQVAVWKIAFDTSLNLFDNTSAMYYNAPDAISMQAQGYLDAVSAGVGYRAPLKLLSNDGAQDLITPAPGPVALLGLGSLCLTSRRRK